MSYERNKVIGLIYRIFQAEEYTWRDSIIPPTYEEIEKCVEGLEYDALENKGFSETGRIKVEYNKEADGFDYYFNLGSD